MTSRHHITIADDLESGLPLPVSANTTRRRVDAHYSPWQSSQRHVNRSSSQDAEDDEPHDRLHPSKGMIGRIKFQLRQVSIKRVLIFILVIIGLITLITHNRRRNPEHPFLPIFQQHENARLHGDVDPTMHQEAIDLNSTIAKAFLSKEHQKWGFHNPIYRVPPTIPPPLTSTSPLKHVPLTIFTTIRDLTAAYQRDNPSDYLKSWNALRSWQLLGKSTGGSSPDIMLFVDHGDETCQHLREEKKIDMKGISCITIPCFAKEYKKPFMHCIWNYAMEHARTEYLTFLNGDIVLLDEFYGSFQATVAQIPHFMMVSQRTDVAPMDWPKDRLKYFIHVLSNEDQSASSSLELPLNGEAEMPNASPDSAFMYEYPYDDIEWMRAFRKHVATKGIRHPDSGIDMFTFHRKVMQLVEFPPFLVGVYRWDNWVLAELLARSASAPFDATHGLRYVHPLSNRTTSTSSSSSSSAIPNQEEGPLHFLVVDATNSLHLIHDNLRSDHLHDLGAVYNDELVKRRSGLRYKMGRIGNADVVLQPPVHLLTGAEGAPVSSLNGCNPSRSNECYLQWNTHTDNDRLDVHLIRHASQKGTIGFVQMSKKYLPLLSNFLCWATQRSQVNHLIFVAEDVKSYQTMQQWGLHFPVLLFPNATDLPKQQAVTQHNAPVGNNADLGGSTTPMEEPSSDPDVPAGAPIVGGGGSRAISARLSPKQAFTNFALLMGWRQSIMSRILDLGFTLLLLDLDTLFFEQPLTMLSTMQRLYATREWNTNQVQYHSQVKSGYPMNVASCTVLATTRQVLITASTATSPAVYEEIYSTNFMSLLPNKYSRFFLKKLQDCTSNILNKYQNIVGTHRKKEPCSYIEDRCAHDILKNMHSELSVNDFLTCAIPKEFWNDQTRFRITDTPSMKPHGATIVAGATTTDVSAPPVSNHVVWPWSNDPSTSWDLLRLSTLTQSREKHLQSAYSALPLLPRPHETLGFSTVSQTSWTFPKLLHDSSLGGVDALQTKISKWKKAGLWCNFQPYRMNMQRALMSPASPASTASNQQQQQLLFLKIHVHLQPRKDFTPAAFRAFLLAMSGASYAPQDSIDIEFDIAQFYTPLQLQRDDIRKQVKALRSKNGGAAVPDEEEALIRKIMDQKNPTSNTAGSGILPDLSFTAPEELSTDISEWPLTLSEILEMFKEWKWAHGMKHMLKKHISIVNPAYIDPLLDPKEQAQALKLINEKAAKDKKAQLLKQQQKNAPSATTEEDEHSHDTFRIRYADEEWLIPYSFHEQSHDGTSASSSSPPTTPTSTASQIDTPILLLNPSLIVHPQWYEFIRKQLVAYPKRHDEPSGVDRRWLGMSILPLISTASALENNPDALSTSGAEIPYPSSHALLAPVIRDQYPEVPSTQLLRLIGQEWIHSEEKRVREENESTGGDSTISGRKESGGYRTQLVNPLGLVLFSSSIHHFTNWRKLQYNAVATTNSITETAANPAAAAAQPLSKVGSFPPCWSRLDPVTQVLPQNPHMVALLRFIFETGSFITAPASQSLSSSPLGVVTRKPQDSENSALPKMKSVDMKSVFLPTSLASLPLFDLSGASVPLPDTLAYRALVLKAASGAGDNDDPHAGCTWPAIHPKVLDTFHVDISQSNV